ncbi:hypothetical protein [uncultured Draconibacterium sp.]|uniref:hypothetical protein n=1 Tax=uncultured Draconibacterium sp. TaxID=1573823 RepID=UPI0032615797
MLEHVAEKLDAPAGGFSYIIREPGHSSHREQLPGQILGETRDLERIAPVLLRSSLLVANTAPVEHHQCHLDGREQSFADCSRASSDLVDSGGQEFGRHSGQPRVQQWELLEIDG